MELIPTSNCFKNLQSVDIMDDCDHSCDCSNFLWAHHYRKFYISPSSLGIFANDCSGSCKNTFPCSEGIRSDIDDLICPILCSCICNQFFEDHRTSLNSIRNITMIFYVIFLNFREKIQIRLHSKFSSLHRQICIK